MRWYWMKKVLDNTVHRMKGGANNESSGQMEQESRIHKQVIQSQSEHCR